jgi:4-amino-4-deoxy-L-arabinose transferase-like glycosyltransferase
VSKRSGTKPSPRPPAPKQGGHGAQQIGTRAFRRRERETGRTRSSAPAAGSTSLIERTLAGLSTVNVSAVVRRVPRAAWICALVACLNAVCWSIISPPFQVIDEPSHFAYVKQLVDTGTRPTSGDTFSAQEILATLQALRYFHVRQQPENHAISSQEEQAELRRETLETNGISHGAAATGVSASQPPLYYALEAIPYGLERHSPVPGRLQLMRFFSALFAGLTALFVFLFIREALPREPWAWVVGGLAIAIPPLLGVMSGAVNPDSMLFAVSAATFYLLARAFRRGLNTRMAVAIGAVMVIGLLTKLNYAGLVPGILLGLLVLAIREARDSRRSALKHFALAAGIGLSPALLLIAYNALQHSALLGPFADVTSLDKGSLLAEINYIWQFYLPRIPGTVNDFPGISTLRQYWFDGYVGLYGWRDTMFPGWVYSVALIPAAVIFVLCARGLFQARAALRDRAPELAVYAIVSVGVMAMVGTASYGAFPKIDAEYFEVRYLFPMLALLGAVFALAARGAGRRWGPTVGALLIVLLLAHDIFSQMLVIGRFYG